MLKAAMDTEKQRSKWHGRQGPLGSLLERWLLPLLSGLLWLLSLQPYGLFGLIFVAFVPLLYSLRREGGFGRGWWTGLALFGPLLHWLRHIDPDLGWVAWGASAPCCSLFPALLGAAFAFFRRRCGPATALLSFPFLGVLVDYSRCFGPLAFPWGMPAHALWQALPLIQIADLTSFYGVTFVILTVNAAFAAFFLCPRQAPAFATAAILGLSLSVGYSLYRLETVDDQQGPPIRVGLIQGNVPLSEKEQSENLSAILEKHLKMSREAVEQGAELLIWPETAVNTYLPLRPDFLADLGDFARETGTYLLLGAIDTKDGETIYNAAFLFGPQGRILGRYHKTHLVTFGEFTPWRKRWAFMQTFSPRRPNEPDYSAGREHVPIPTGLGRLGTPICFDAIFPQIPRDFVRQGTEVLSIITNDAWFGPTEAAAQHLALAVFRAIETRRHIARTANTGISCFITPRGWLRGGDPHRYQALFRGDPKDLFTDEVLVGEVHRRRDLTFYARFGDVFVWGCGVVVVGVGIGCRRRRSPRNGTSLRFVPD